MIEAKNNDRNKDLNIYRHGDVDILPIEEELPDGLEEVIEDSHILAYGEATGHSHKLLAHPGTVATILKGFNRKWIKIQNGLATLTHPEHKALEISPGIYEIKIEREYDYFNNEIQMVRD